MALLDRGRSSKFNPGLPALSFSKDRITVGWHGNPFSQFPRLIFQELAISALINSVLSTYHIQGYSFDIGWAGKLTRIPLLPGLRANFGLAFFNLGPVIYNDGDPASSYSESLPQQYRLGYALDYRPIEGLLWAKRK